ncbi:MAG: DUF2148 domain-containing protein [bacterium]|nr:DUF2148 domain-containing protein [bacterium]
MKLEWDWFVNESLIAAAREMAVAARTAPKARGRDQLHILIITDPEKDAVADRMQEIGNADDIEFFRRDAGNLRDAPVLLLIGTECSPLELSHCGFCGYADCAENRQHGVNPCAFSTGDLGIAVGSAVSLAARRHVDNRIMFSAGKAAIELGLFPHPVTVAYGIPLSATGKNPFFDRK